MRKLYINTLSGKNFNIEMQDKESLNDAIYRLCKENNITVYQLGGALAEIVTGLFYNVTFSTVLKQLYPKF